MSPNIMSVVLNVYIHMKFRKRCHLKCLHNLQTHTFFSGYFQIIPLILQRQPSVLNNFNFTAKHITTTNNLSRGYSNS